MVVEIKHRTLVELEELSAGDCFIYDNTVYMLLEHNDDYIRMESAFPCIAVTIETGHINKLASWAEVVKVNAKVIIE